MSGLKSSYEIAMEKMKDMGIDDSELLSDGLRAAIAELRKEYEAKIAEKKILLEDAPELPDEISFLKRKQEEKIKELKIQYQQAK